MGLGSSLAASFCAARKIPLSFVSACSKARVDDGRDHERHHHVREDDNIAQRHDRERVVDVYRIRLFDIAFGETFALTSVHVAGVNEDHSVCDHVEGRAGLRRELGQPRHDRIQYTRSR